MGSLRLADLTSALVEASEKAACIARVMRSEHALFSLLVQEKTGEAKNKRFVEDFKTLGDVLVQETVRHDLGRHFSGIKDQIYGEESNTFTNKLGESVTVEVKATQDATCQQLAQVLDGNQEAANLLAEAVHTDVVMETDARLLDLSVEVPIENIGIWIDPIDSTAQYIHGYESVQADGGVYSEGLQCVVVLIGAYDRTTGLPLIGVINQPFAQQDLQSRQWTGRYCWGLSYQDTNLNCLIPPPGGDPENLGADLSVVMSTSENKSIQAKLKGDFNVTFAAGAGYKVLCVVDGLMSAYVLSQGSTFKWDTCGPHALLASQGGGIVDFQKALDIVRSHQDQSEDALLQLLSMCSLCYNKPDSTELEGGQKWSNSGGFVAYRNKSVLLNILNKLI